ncbi:hypothetical protein EIO_2102 [Ketogulonicigenium vulgare Y25]|nr:hypothetical protein EIO_2102 [Ketogulonicigenium vulgare Y25]
MSVCEFTTASFSEKSEVTNAHVSAPNEKATSAACAVAAGAPKAIQPRHPFCAPYIGTIICKIATAKARISAKCPSSTVMSFPYRRDGDQLSASSR